MADTLINTVLPPFVWVDLYAATGIPIGTSIQVENIGSVDLRLFSGAVPPVDFGQGAGYSILKIYQEKDNSTGDAGAFAIAIGRPGLINVSIA